MSLAWKDGHAKVYCDHCGAEAKYGEVVVYSILPFNTDSANQGESGVVCYLCDEALRNSP